MSARSRAHPWFADFAFDVNRHAHHRDRVEREHTAAEEADFWAWLRDRVGGFDEDLLVLSLFGQRFEQKGYRLRRASVIGLDEVALRLAERPDSSLLKISLCPFSVVPKLAVAMAHAIRAERHLAATQVLSETEGRPPDNAWRQTT